MVAQDFVERLTVGAEIEQFSHSKARRGAECKINTDKFNFATFSTAPEQSEVGKQSSYTPASMATITPMVNGEMIRTRP